MSVLFSKKRVFIRQFVSALVIFMVTFSALSPAVFAEATTTPETPVIEGCTNELAQNYNPDATVDDGECEYETSGDNAVMPPDDTASSTDDTNDDTASSTDPIGDTGTSTASSTDQNNNNDGEDGQDGDETGSATSTATSTDDGTGDAGADGTEGLPGTPGTEDTSEPIPVVSENEIGPDPTPEDGDESVGETGGEIADEGGHNITIETGAAKAQAEFVNDVNSNLVSSALDSAGGDLDTYRFTATGTNYADVTTNADALAATGDNKILNAWGTSTINTGDAVAGINIANIINSNVVNSEGFLYLKNQIVDPGESLNLSSFFFPDPEETKRLSSDCSLLSCHAEDVEYYFMATNTAVITNDVDLEAVSGRNTAEGGDMVVHTGDARGGANVINVVNTNIVDSNYRLLTYNAMGDLDGDLILPTEELLHAFFSKPNGMARMIADEGADAVDLDLAVLNDNQADVNNNVEANAETGDNEMYTTDSSSEIVTGNSKAESNILDKVNQNIFGGDSMYLLIRIHGDWDPDGQVVGLPDGLVWEWLPEANSILIKNEGAEIALSPILENHPDGDSYMATSSVLNDVKITNDITIDAITGKNAVDGYYGQIKTGNAYASANLMNIANTNVIGTNWTYAVINIFGDFDGDVSFAGADADATNDDDTDPEELPDDETATTTATSTPPVELDPTPTPPTGGSCGGCGGSKKSNKSNTKNVERVVEEVDPNAPPFLVIQKTSNVDEGDVVIAGEAVDYTITVTNRGGQAYDAVVYDTLRNPIGSVMYEDSWDLGTIKAGEVIELEYTTSYDFKTPSGEYTNTAKVEAYRTADSKKNGDDPLKISDAVHTIEIKGLPLAVGNVSVLAVFPGTNGNVSALLSWETSKQAESQVFYGEKLPYSVFNENFFNYGYPQKSFKFSTPKTNHLMIISGLKPGASYSYRIDAQTSEHDFVSREYSFTLPNTVTSLSLNIGTTFMSTETILGRVAGASTTIPPAPKPPAPKPAPATLRDPAL